MRRLLVAVAAALGPSIFRLRRAQDGTELPGGARLVVDGGFVNLFVLPAGEREVALVDCGEDLAGRAMRAELGRRGLGPEAVRAIFLTHGHADHVGACRLFPAARVFAFEGDRGLVEGTEAPGGRLGRLLARQQRDRAVRVTDPLSDGQTVRIGALAVRAFAVPGHTAGSAAFLANGVLFLGDAANARADGGLVPAPRLFSLDASANRASLARLAVRLAAERAPVEVIAFAHSGPVASLAPLLELARRS